MADSIIKKFVYKFVSDTKGLKQGNTEAKNSIAELIKSIDNLIYANKNNIQKLTELGQQLSQSSKLFSSTTESSDNQAQSNEELASSYDDLNKSLNKNKESVNKSLNVSKKQNEDTDKQILSVSLLTRNVLGLAAAYFSVRGMVNSLTDSFRSIFSVIQQSQLLTIDANQLKAWQQVAEQFGISGQSIAPTLKNISTELGRFFREGGGVFASAQERLGAYGFSLFDQQGNIISEERLLLNLIDLYRRLSKENNNATATADKNFIASQLFLNEELQLLAEQISSQELLNRILDQRSKNLPITSKTEEDFRTLVNLSAQISQNFKGLGEDFVITYAPQIIEILDIVNTAVERWRKNIKEGTVIEQTSKGFLGIFELIKLNRDINKSESQYEQLSDDLEDAIKRSLNKGFNTSFISPLNTGTNISINNVEVNSNADNVNDLINDILDVAGNPQTLNQNDLIIAREQLANGRLA